MKFGTVPSAMPNFTLLGGYLGISGPKNMKICQKISKVANFFAMQGRIPRPILVKFMCYMHVTCLRSVLKFGAIWFINDKFVGKKTGMGHLPQIFVWRAIKRAQVPAVKEPISMMRDDNKRPDGSTLLPWAKGNPWRGM